MGRPGMNVTPEMMQRFQNMKPGNGGKPDTAAMKRFMKMQNNQQGGSSDTTVRRRTNRQSEQGQGQNEQGPAQRTIQN